MQRKCVSFLVKYQSKSSVLPWEKFLMNRHFFLASNFRDISTNSSYAVFLLMYFKSFINIS